jgi:hypothetical protein
MTHQILGGGGADTEIATGLPKITAVEARQQKTVNKYRTAMSQALGLAQELQVGSPVVRVLAEKYRRRLTHLASQDAECRALLEIIGALRHTLEVAPQVAEDEVRRVMGPQLVHFLEESEAAPD